MLSIISYNRSYTWIEGCNSAWWQSDQKGPLPNGGKTHILWKILICRDIFGDCADDIELQTSTHGSPVSFVNFLWIWSAPFPSWTLPPPVPSSSSASDVWPWPLLVPILPYLDMRRRLLYIILRFENLFLRKVDLLMLLKRLPRPPVSLQEQSVSSPGSSSSTMTEFLRLRRRPMRS